jgi:hypothetical protein
MTEPAQPQSADLRANLRGTTPRAARAARYVPPRRTTPLGALVPALLLAGIGQLGVACNAEDERGTSPLATGQRAPASASGAVSGGAEDAPPSSTAAPTATSPSPGPSSSPGTPDAGLHRHDDASTPPPPQNPPPPAGDPCAGVVCPDGQACVSEAHGQALGVCVDTCDCSNCGNCSYDNADGRWDDMQEYCGNRGKSPATMACNRPCGGGMGCIYYGAVNVCWPLEGCFSL